MYAQSVIGTMVAELAADAAATQAARARRGSEAQARLACRTAALIEQRLNCGAALTLDGLAEELFVSRSALCAAFKAETGSSIGTYVRRKRSLAAEELLLEGSLSVAQIATKLGFSRQSSFSQAFKQEHGMSPSQWRTANR